MSASWITKINQSSSRFFKEDVIKQALEAAALGSTNSIFFLKMLKFCYDPYITYGVRQIPETFGIINAENPWNEFKSLLLELASGQLSGNRARHVIKSMSERFDSDEWNIFLAPVIRRDMRCGITETTINKVCENTEYEIPVFSCQLATNCEGRPEMRGLKRLEPKLDGVRMLMIVKPNLSGTFTTVSLSRNGKVFENFNHIERQISDFMTNMRKTPSRATFFNMSNGIVFDGEIVGNSFQDLMRSTHRKDDVQTNDSVYHIFDFIPLDDFRRGYWNANLDRRLMELRRILQPNPRIYSMPNVELLPYVEVNLDTPDGRGQFDIYRRDMVSRGVEGVMIKDPSAPYECKRNTFWMKYKPVHDYDLTIIGVEPGTGKNKEKLGALVCEGMDGIKHIIVNVGSGFTDTERQDYWNNRNDLIGRTAVVKADTITLNQNGIYSLRFPRFKSFRYDK